MSARDHDGLSSDGQGGKAAAVTSDYNKTAADDYSYPQSNMISERRFNHNEFLSNEVKQLVRDYNDNSREDIVQYSPPELSPAKEVKSVQKSPKKSKNNDTTFLSLPD